MRDERGVLGVRRVGEHWGHTHRIPSRTRDALDALENNSSGGEHVPASQGSEDGMRWNGVAWHGVAWHLQPKQGWTVHFAWDTHTGDSSDPASC